MLADQVLRLPWLVDSVDALAKQDGQHENDSDESGARRKWERGASVAALVSVSALVLVVSFSWIIAYVVWFVCPSCTWPSRVLAPFRWLLRHQPTWPLALLLVAVISLVLFFRPILDFVTDLEEARGFKRRSRQPEESPVMTAPKRGPGEQK